MRKHFERIIDEFDLEVGRLTRQIVHLDELLRKSIKECLNIDQELAKFFVIPEKATTGQLLSIFKKAWVYRFENGTENYQKCQQIYDEVIKINKIRNKLIHWMVIFTETKTDEITPKLLNFRKSDISEEFPVSKVKELRKDILRISILLSEFINSTIEKNI